MKCHLCTTELTPEPFETWNIGDQCMIIHRCNNAQCRPQIFDRMEVDLILPDNEVSSFNVLFPMKDKWYRIYSDSGFPHPVKGAKPQTKFFALKEPRIFRGGYPDEEEIFTLERFYPIDWSGSWEQQLEVIKEKFKTLILFS